VSFGVILSACFDGLGTALGMVAVQMRKGIAWGKTQRRALPVRDCHKARLTTLTSNYMVHSLANGRVTVRLAQEPVPDETENAEPIMKWRSDMASWKKTANARRKIHPGKSRGMGCLLNVEERSGKFRKGESSPLRVRI